MKQSIEWHENCLTNRKGHLDKQVEMLEAQTERVAKDRQSFGLYSAQIDLAKKEGKESFDSDKYAIRRLCV